MKLPEHCYASVWTVILWAYFSKPIELYCVECFGEVDNGHEEVHILFLTFFFVLLCKKHVYCSSVFSESTMTALQYKSSMIKIHIQAIGLSPISVQQLMIIEICLCGFHRLKDYLSVDTD